MGFRTTGSRVPAWDFSLLSCASSQLFFILILESPLGRMVGALLGFIAPTLIIYEEKMTSLET